MIAFLFTPIGRYIAIGAVILAALGGAYLKIRADAQAEMTAKASLDALRRSENAIRAGDAVDLGSSGLRKHDGNERD